MEIYHDILTAIEHESLNGEIKPTRVQHLSNMSYDKVTRYLDELAKKNMIKNSPFLVTVKGQKFLEDYSKIKNFIQEMHLEYVNETGDQNEV